jgi:trehalose 6-phosphate phosphatase
VTVDETETGHRGTGIDGVPEFWQRVASSGHRCLVLDYDGTLSHFHEDRMTAFPLEGVVELLTEIRDAGRTYLAIMTGRPLHELDALLGDLGIPVSGSQGSEFRFPDGTTQTHLPTDRQEERLHKGLEEARLIAPADRVERKVASVAVHTRGIPEDEAGAIENGVCSAWSVDAEAYDLECRRFCGGVELRLKGIDKGTAITVLLDGRSDDSLCVYIGDDNTDEDAFEVLRDRGVGIRVGSREENTLAKGHLGSPEDVREFLRQWLIATTGQ